MHMFPFQSSSPWYNHNFFLNSGFVSQTCALGSSNNSWQADLVCGWRRFAAYVHVCVWVWVWRCTLKCVYTFGSQRLEADVFSLNPHLIFLLCPYAGAMAHVLLSGDNTSFYVGLRPSGLAVLSHLPTFHLIFWEEGLSLILKYPDMLD